MLTKIVFHINNKQTLHVSVFIDSYRSRRAANTALLFAGFEADEHGYWGVPAGLKPAFLLRLTARLKSCPP